MESFVRLVVITIVAGVCSMVFAEQPAPGASAQATVSVVGSEDANLPALPFLAEITSDDVYVRSGPGTNYYYCSKLKKADKVKVVGSKFSWWQIVPPAGSYTWISKQYVQVDPQNSASGTVIGDAVRVYAGSDDVQPMHSTTWLVKLNKGEKVTLLGEEKEDYYKIASPEGAYLWVSNQYTKPLGSLVSPAQTQPIPAAQPTTPAPFPTPATATKPRVISPNEPNTPAPVPMSLDDQKNSEVQILKERVDAERAKPADQQNFAEMKKLLEVIANNKQTPRAAKSAQYLLKTIERCELAKEVAKAVKIQDEQLGQTQQRIESARAAKLAQFEDISIFAVMGQLRESSVFAEGPGIRYYRILDSEGKTVCYARPAGEAADIDLSKFIDKRVGLVGTIEPNAELGGALVEFTKILELP
jgi:uncharacterized protein YgiM (DUF1202 family)